MQSLQKDCANSLILENSDKRYGLRRQSAAATALSGRRGAWKFQPVRCVRKRCRASLATAVQNDGVFHDSHSFLIAAFSAAFFSAKEGSPSAIRVAKQPRNKMMWGFIKNLLVVEHDSFAVTSKL
jgi:hypothetical protein